MWRIILIIGILLSVASCSIYHPQMIDIPLLEEKKDLRIDANVSIDPFIQPAINATVSYGITNHFAVQGGADITSGTAWYLQGALGYFTPLPNKMVIEAYAGFGYGMGDTETRKQTDTTIFNPTHYMGQHNQYFAQVNWGFTNLTKAHIDVGLGFKGGLFQTNLHNIWLDDQTINRIHGNYLLIEPVAFIRLGGEKVKFKIQVGYCQLFDTKKMDIPYTYMPFSVGVGANFNL